jgi:putative hemolysin
MEVTDNKKFIDIDGVFQSKNPSLYRLMPGFILRYLKGVVHQDEINSFIERHGHKTTFDFVAAIIDEFGANVQTKGTENIPESGGCVFVSNHPLGGLDAMALVQVIGSVRKDIKFIVNDILLQLKNLNQIFTGVNKHGKNTQEVYSSLDALYSSGQGVLIFPAGLVSRKINGKIVDLEWKKSFITKARRYQLPVIPVYIEGRNSDFFYNLANWRKRSGIKANIEMLYLPDEMYRQKNKTITVIFGKPIPASAFEPTYSDHHWAQLVKEHVYSLPVEGTSRVMATPK